MDTIEELWQRIEAWMHRQVPQRWHQLAPGASEEAIKNLESALNITLPQDVRASYLRHDGGYKFAPVVPMRALPVAEILDTWQMLRELLDDEEWAAQPPYYFTEEVLRFGEQPGPIQPVWWHPRWIPLAMDNAGNLTCLDMAPLPGGAIGQIIDQDHECGPSSQVLFPSFHHLLSAFADHLEGTADKQIT